MLRRFLVILVVLLPTGTTNAQPIRQTLISAAKNYNAKAVTIDSKDVTPDCDTPWAVTLTTLHGGKQEGSQLLTLDNGKMQIVFGECAQGAEPALGKKRS